MPKIIELSELETVIRKVVTFRKTNNMTVADIAERLDVTKGLVSSVINQLMAHKIVERKKSVRTKELIENFIKENKKELMKI